MLALPTGILRERWNQLKKFDKHFWHTEKRVNI
jgi:hypothetical protein